MDFSFDKYLLGTLCLFGVASFLTVAGANVFLGLSIILFLIMVFKKKKDGILIENTNYFKAVGVFASALLISAMFSGNVGYGLKTWANFFLWHFMPFIIILLVLATKEKVSKLLCAATCGFMIDCLYAIYEGVFVYKLNVAHSRAAGFVGHPMTLAGWECILLPVLLVFIFRKDISKKMQFVCVAMFAIGSVALVFNSTRGAWLTLAIVLPLISLPFILKSKKLFVVFTSIILVVCFALLNSSSVMKRIDSIADTKNWSNASRFIIWDTAFGMFKEHPVLGVGLGQFKSEFKRKFVDSEELKAQATEYQNYRKNLEQKKLTDSQKKMTKKKVKTLARADRKMWENKHLRSLNHAHNNIMQMLGENGLVGLLGYICVFGYILWSNFKNYFVSKNPYALMIVGSTTALLLQGLTEYNFGHGTVMKIYWLVLACLIVLAREYDEEGIGL